MKNRESQSSAAQKSPPPNVRANVHARGASPSATDVRKPLPHEQGRPRASSATPTTPRQTQNPKAVQRKPSQAPRTATTRTRATAAPNAPRASTPAAPPVYRPQPTPAVLQRKEPPGRAPLRANQTTTTPAAANAARRPAAPPVYRPQPAPKILQAKPALPQAAAPRSATARPSASLRQTPAPTQAPRPFQPPAAHARTRPAPPARLGVLQLMEERHVGGSGGDDDDWQKELQDIQAQQERYRELSRNQKDKQKQEKEEKKYSKSNSNTNNSNSTTTTTTTVPQSTLAVTTSHLSNFSVPHEIFGETLKQKKRPKANQVSLVAKVNGNAVGTSNGDTEHDDDVTSPSTDVCVSRTTGDGEVVPLVGAMRSFLAHLKRPKNQKTPQNFTIALFGFWGACDGCKQRLIRFVQVWEVEARRYMKTGVAATLKITYKYAYPAEVFDRDWGKIKYGWDEDGEDGPCFHTIEANVTGANDKV